VYVDPRVAHGVAKLRLTSDPGERDRQIQAVTRSISDALFEVVRRKMTTRDARRHLERTLLTEVPDAGLTDAHLL